MSNETINQAVGRVAQVAQTKPSFVPTVEQVDPRNLMRILLPLDGEEVIKAILAFVEKMLRNSGKFNESQVYEEIVWRFRLDAQWQGYANTAVRMDTAGGITGGDGDKPKDAQVIVDNLTVEGAQVKTDLAPDEIRELTNQPVPVLNTGTGGSKVIRVDSSKLKRR